MDLIVTHENTDFDALAACVAAQRLHPGATIGLGRRLGREVRAYWALHKDVFDAKRIDNIDLEQVRRLIVVDLRDRRRLRHVESILARRDAGDEVELHVCDHHPASEHDLTGDVHVVEPLGAITTALVERIRAEGISIDAHHATLFALGIYADTDSLTLAHTTARDARAVAWLLERRADLAMIERYLRPGLSETQRAALVEVLAAPAVEAIGDEHAAFAVLDREDAVDGLASVVSEARRIGGFEALVVAARVRGKSKIQVVARSRAASIDVGAALRTIGGGGHRGAASAVVRDGTDPESVCARVLAALREHPPQKRVVGEVMSRPVCSATPEMPLAELGALLDARGHHGAPIVKRDGTLVGIVSKRDVARARAAGREQLPASSHMSGQVHVTTPETTLDEALAMMVERDVGRLPVVEAEELVGIVSRSDLLRWLYPGTSAPLT